MKEPTLPLFQAVGPVEVFEQAVRAHFSLWVSLASLEEVTAAEGEGLSLSL